MKKIFVALFLMVAFNLPANAGFSLGQTRVVYDAKNKQATLRLINSGDSSHFLVQSWVDDKDNKSTEDFIITPPVFKFFPKSENTLVIKSIADNLSEEHESLYYLNVKAIPAIDNSIQNRVAFATKNVIKLIYRPAKLNTTGAINAAREVKVKREGANVIVSNPTPYIINFGYFYVNGKEQKLSYVLPFSENKVPLTGVSEPRTVKFNTINDFGGTSDYTTLGI